MVVAHMYIYIYKADRTGNILLQIVVYHTLPQFLSSSPAYAPTTPGVAEDNDEDFRCLFRI